MANSGAQDLDVCTLVEAIWRHGVAATAHSLEGAVAAARTEISPDLIHIGVDGRRSGYAEYMARVAAAVTAGAVTVETGPLEALVLAPDAVLLTYPLHEQVLRAGSATSAYERASVLWVEQDGRWQTVFIHATPLQAAVERFGDEATAAAIARILRHDAEVETGVAELTVAERKWEAIRCERAAVEQLRHHDVAAARAATHPECVIVETDGSRQGCDGWLALVANWRRSVEEVEFGPMQVVAVTPAAMLIVYSLATRGTLDGTPFELTEALSALWLHRAGEWRCVFMQGTTQAS